MYLISPHPTSGSLLTFLFLILKLGWNVEDLSYYMTIYPSSLGRMSTLFVTSIPSSWVLFDTLSINFSALASDFFARSIALCYDHLFLSTVFSYLYPTSVRVSLSFLSSSIYLCDSDVFAFPLALTNKLLLTIGDAPIVFLYCSSSGHHWG